jgi:hypothetical protein
LVRVDPEREREVADLIVACESLQQEAGRLLTRVVNLLREEGRDGCVSRLSSPSAAD